MSPLSLFSSPNMSFLWGCFSGFLFITRWGFFSFQFGYDVLWYSFLQVLCLEFVELFWTCEFILSINFWKCLAINSNFFLSLCFSFSETQITHLKSIEFILQLADALFTFFFCFLVLCFIWIISMTFKLTSHCSVISNLPLIPSSVFFISHILVHFFKSLKVWFVFFPMIHEST